MKLETNSGSLEAGTLEKTGYSNGAVGTWDIKGRIKR